MITHLEGPPGTKTKCGVNICDLPRGERVVGFHNETDATCPVCIQVWEGIHKKKYGAVVNVIHRHILQVDEALSLLDEERVEQIVDILRIVRQAKGSVWIAGNGGSAATASHFANDLSKMGHCKAISISDLTPTTLAHGNDDGWDNMFSNAVENHLGPKDAVIGISCSGNSENIIKFLEMAKGRYRIALTGPGVSKLYKLQLDIMLQVMADEITVIEDVHSIVCHGITRSLQ